MSKTVIVTTSGFVPQETDRFCENVAEVEQSTLLRCLPQMINCLFDPMVPQIEDPSHPLNGWQVVSIIIERPEEFEDPAGGNYDFEFDDWSAERGDE
jgi:hypothetical protein